MLRSATVRAQGATYGFDARRQRLLHSANLAPDQPRPKVVGDKHCASSLPFDCAPGR